MGMTNWAPALFTTISRPRLFDVLAHVADGRSNRGFGQDVKSQCFDPFSLQSFHFRGVSRRCVDMEAGIVEGNGEKFSNNIGADEKYFKYVQVLSQ